MYDQILGDASLSGVELLVPTKKECWRSFSDDDLGGTPSRSTGSRTCYTLSDKCSS